MTTTLVTLPEPTVPLPLETAHVCPAGALATVTLYGDPDRTGAGNANVPLASQAQGVAALSLSTTVPDRPETVPPMV